MSKPKIFVFTTSYYPFIGGAEIAIQEVAQRLAREFNFFIVTSRIRRSLPRREIRPEGTVVRLGFGTRFDKWLLPVLAPLYLVLSSKFQVPGSVLWGMDISQGSLAAAGIKFLYPRIPLVLTVQYGEHERRLRSGRFGMIGGAFRLMLGRADRLTAISRYLVRLSRDFGYCGPATLIHNGAEMNKFKVQSSEFKVTNQNSKVIITVSRLVPKNGVDILIRAIAEVKKKIPDVRCQIIGDGAERDNYRSLVNEYGLERHITFLGEISHDELPRYLHNADIFVRPSRSEGMGNAFVEALAAGLSIIGTPVGGIPDIIEDGKTGLLARVDDPQDLAEKIISIFNNPSYGQTLSRTGLEKIEKKFSWDNIAGEYRAIFHQALGAKRRVVVATGLFPPEIGGPATYSNLLVDELPQQIGRAHV